MALNAAIVFELRTGGSNNNGGGFKTGASGTDRTLQNGAFASLTTLSVVNGTTTKITISLTDYTVVTADIGNVYQNTGGTSTAGFYEITGVDTVANTWTLDRAIGTAGQTCTGAMGGALKDPGYWAGIGALVNGNSAYLKNDGSAFSITSASTNIAAGTIAPAVNALLIGYGSTRTITNTDSPPTIQLNVASATMVATSGGLGLINIICDGNSQTSAKLSSGGQFDRCQIINFKANTTGTSMFHRCTATINSAAIFTGGAFACEAYANTATPFALNSGTQAFVCCLSYANTGSTTDGFSSSNSNLFVGCVAYNNGRHGFNVNGPLVTLVNCIAESNSATGGTGFLGAGAATVLYNCATYLNNIATSGITANYNAVTLSASAFTAAGSNNFSLNNTAGGGAALRAAGYPGVFPRGTTTGSIDIGAAQHADPVATSGGFFIQ